MAFSPADMEGRRWLLERFQDVGIPAWMDVYGNVFGCLGEAGQGKAILIGSHLDTVPEAGMFDGALGVLAGLECLRTLKESGVRLPYDVQVVAFANEEGTRLGPGLFGSRALLEGIPHDEWQRVLPVLDEAGLGRGAGPGPSLDPASLRAYLELHVEQGGVLDASGEDIGVVQGIVCLRSFNAVFLGEANHAGTTPMEHRKDALLGAAELVLSVPTTVRRLGSGTTVGTCGRNVVPGEVEISFDVRDLDEGVVERVIESLRTRAQEIASSRGLEVLLTPMAGTLGAMMAPEIQDVIEGEAIRLGLSFRRMPSGAGHDAMVFGKKVPSGMIFVPSRGGKSHSPDEWTSKEHCGNGAQVLLGTVIALAGLYTG